MLPVETTRSNKTLITIERKYGHQPARRLGWAALAYHKQKGATPYPGPRKHCLQNDGKPDERLGVRVGTWNVGSGRGTEECEELRKRRMDVCCLQEVRWRGQGARFMGRRVVKGRRYKLWWSGNSDGTGGVGVLVKEELCEKVVEVRRKSDRVMTVVMALEEEVVRIICVYGPQSGRTCAEKDRFYDDLGSEWNLHSVGELVLAMGDFNGHVGKQIEGYEGMYGVNRIGKRNVEGKMLLEFRDEKELCMANTWFRKGEKRKVTYSAGENETEIDFALVGKGNRKFLRDVEVIPGELQHRLVVMNLVKNKVKKVVRKEAIERRKVWKLKEDDTRARFEGRVGL